MRFRHVVRGGTYLRVADPSWASSLDGRFAAERGARWNPPDSFPVVYLCSTVDIARANVLKRFDGLPYSALDLLPERRPTLVETEVRSHRAVDVVTDAGCRAAGLPTTYPRIAEMRNKSSILPQDSLLSKRPAESRVQTEIKTVTS